MNALTIAGGVYQERCTWPKWNNTYGSGGRAAVAVAGHLASVELYTYATALAAQKFMPTAELFGIAFHPSPATQLVSFDYVHSLSNPIIRPIIGRIHQNDPITVAAEAVLRFGMLEGSARVSARRCVYDPQSAFDPEAFDANGSEAEELAIVANRAEIAGMTGASDPVDGAKALLARGAQLVVVKSGAEGAYVVSHSRSERVPAFQSERVWTIGSGDVFAAVFAARWAVSGDKPMDAARLASQAVASYAEGMALPVPAWGDLASSGRKETVSVPGQVYLASPFFTLGERWVVEEALRGLQELGLRVFSPFHEIGPGVANVVAPADIAGIDASDRVFAVLDGTDSGTLFEVGYAVAKGIPVYALAQNVSDEDLKMVQGSGCRVYSDFVTALHHTAWKL